jgi:DNA-binding MarR family transcriptional regulator
LNGILEFRARLERYDKFRRMNHRRKHRSDVAVGRSNLIERIGPSDLTAPQFATLARLYERGTLSQNLLGRLVAMEPANIRDVVLRLKRRRLVMTRRDPEDGRLVLVSLTPAGLSLVEKLLPIEIECTAKTLARLNATEKTLLYELLDRLADS